MSMNGYSSSKRSMTFCVVSARAWLPHHQKVSWTLSVGMGPGPSGVSGPPPPQAAAARTVAAAPEASSALLKPFIAECPSFPSDEVAGTAVCRVEALRGRAVSFCPSGERDDNAGDPRSGRRGGGVPGSGQMGLDHGEIAFSQ